MSLPGGLVQRLEAALLDAFPDDDALDELIKHVGMRARVPARAALTTRVGKLVEVVDAHGRVRDLLDSALELTPGNARLAQIRPAILAQLEDASSAVTSIEEPPPAPAGRTPATTPLHASAEAEALSKQLEDARTRKQSLLDAGLVTAEVDREILQLRRTAQSLSFGTQLRVGSQGDPRRPSAGNVGRAEREHELGSMTADLVILTRPRRRWWPWIAAVVVIALAAGVYVLPTRGDDASQRRTAPDELLGRAAPVSRDASLPLETAPDAGTTRHVPDATPAAGEDGAVATRGGPSATATPRAEVCDLIDINDVAVTTKDDAVLLDVTMQNNGARIASVTRVRLEIVEATPPRMVVAASAVYPLMLSRRSNELAFSHEVAPGGKVERLQLRTGASAAYAGSLIKANLHVKYGRGCWARSDRFTFIAPSRPAKAVDEPTPSP